jgi:hypothetical protein
LIEFFLLSRVHLMRQTGREGDAWGGGGGWRVDDGRAEWEKGVVSGEWMERKDVWGDGKKGGITGPLPPGDIRPIR